MVETKPGRLVGFTLIELSIVLVIIGLIIGGILVGQDLIRAAAVRAQISQIEKYNTAVNTFYGKFRALPGDLNQATATTFGFASRGQYAGEGDGNGIIEGIDADAASNNDGYVSSQGETGMFWVDLSSAVGGSLIDGGFHSASPTGAGAVNTLQTTTGVGLFYPSAKVGGGNYIYVWSGGYARNGGDSMNYFGLSSVSAIHYGFSGTSNNALTVQQAYNIDKKMDDGLPQSGKVLAMYPLSANFGMTWSNEYASYPDGDPYDGFAGSTQSCWDPTTRGPVVAGDGAHTSANSASCMDNGNSAGATEQYSTGFQNGANVNCALSFKFQ